MNRNSVSIGRFVQLLSLTLYSDARVHKVTSRGLVSRGNSRYTVSELNCCNFGLFWNNETVIVVLHVSSRTKGKDSGVPNEVEGDDTGLRPVAPPLFVYPFRSRPSKCVGKTSGG